MLKEEILSIRAALGGVLGKLDPDGAELIRRCRRNLDAVAEQAEELESRLVPHSISDMSAICKMDRPPISGETVGLCRRRSDGFFVEVKEDAVPSS